MRWRCEMSSKQETIEDIVDAIRNEGHAGDASCLEWVGAKIRGYADRIEAAAKREREAGAEAAQVCGEIGEMIGMEATREKSSWVGNAPTYGGPPPRYYEELLSENARLRAALAKVAGESEVE